LYAIQQTFLFKMSFTINFFLLMYTCLIHWACIDNKVADTKKVIINNISKAPILWTVDFSADGKYYAVGGDDGSLKIFSTDNHTLHNSYNLSAAVQCLDWNNGPLLAIALDDSPVQVLNIETGRFHILQETTGSRALAWNSNGKLLAIGDYEGSLQIWSNKAKLIRSVKKNNNKTYLSVDWHPAKDIILTGSDKIRLFDTSGTLLKSIKHRVEETPILTVKWHPSGVLFSTGDYGENENGIESLLQFWSADGTLIKSLHGSKGEYRNIRWNKSGKLLATASDALRLWSKEGQLVHSGSSPDLLWGIDWDNQNKSIITTSQKGSIKLWSNKAGFIKEIKD
jgi:WD40 repeat protein